MNLNGHKVKIFVSIIVGLGLLSWTLWNVKFSEMGQILLSARYVFLIPMLLLLFFSHWLRAYRWQFLLAPVKFVPVASLFSALMVGYMANSFMPAHLGEFVRAYILGKKEQISTTMTFSTIVAERIIDMFSFFFLMVCAMVLYPFPNWVKQSGYFIFFGTTFLFIFLVFLKIKSSATFKLMAAILKPFPASFYNKIEKFMISFLGGLNGLENRKHYFLLSILSILIWLCYGVIFYIGFFMFHLEVYHLNALTALVLLVITTVGVIIPNSPGYVGTYHKLCQLGLGLFGVPVSLGASFAVVLHAINFIPVLLIGLIFAAKEGLSLSTLSSRKTMQAGAMSS